MCLQYNRDVALCVFLLGLFPVLYLSALQAMLLIMIIVIGLLFRQINRSTFWDLLTFPNVAIAQFCLFFLLNAVVFGIIEGNKPHLRANAIESWSGTFVCLVILALWLRLKNPEGVKNMLISWLPAGLTVSFLIASAVYYFGNQGSQIELLATTSLTPPFWFLVLTICSFSWFSQMNGGHKIWRIALLIMAGVMAIYGSARLVMFAWMLSGGSLTFWFLIQTTHEDLRRVLLKICLCIVVSLGTVWAVDFFSGGLLSLRMSYFYQVDLNYESIGTHFRRLKIWLSALSIISDNLIIGVGQFNERFVLRQELVWDDWLRAHQTYLSYLIAGGIPALVSGLIMQTAVLAFLSRTNRSALFPAFLGLAVVVTMNGLTDSIFQSAVNVQVFMAATLIFLRTSNPLSADWKAERRLEL